MIEKYCNKDNPHTKDTPGRIERMYKEMFINIDKDLMRENILTLFPAEDKQMIIVRDIQFTSMCAHHFLPFIGSVDIGYVPKKSLTGISKFARVVKMFSLKPQIQEIMTREIYDYLMLYLKPEQLIIKITAEHQCMSGRGIRAVGSKTITFKKSNNADTNTFFNLLLQ